MVRILIPNIAYLPLPIPLCGLPVRPPCVASLCATGVKLLWGRQHGNEDGRKCFFAARHCRVSCWNKYAQNTYIYIYVYISLSLSLYIYIYMYIQRCIIHAYKAFANNRYGERHLRIHVLVFNKHLRKKATTSTHPKTQKNIFPSVASNRP